jgi:PhoPQ-activated pathogenicity-related protein
MKRPTARSPTHPSSGAGRRSSPRPAVAVCGFLLAALLGAFAAHAQDASTPPSEVLRDYVEKPDPSYQWKVHARFEDHGSEIVVLLLDSQTWKGVLWKHQLFLIRPKRLKTPQQGLMIVAGGRWRERYATEVPEKLPRQARLFTRIAERLGSVVAVVGEVPFQPLFDRTEDQLIAYSFERYLQTGDPTWPLLLPMVKSAVRAMDATQAFSTEQWHLPIGGFTVLGGSKRGWTTWLTGAVDKRATALVPVVIDALNFAEHFPHQRAFWGKPSVALRPYTQRNLDRILASPDGRALREIVDPYSYREMLRQPKLIVIGTNDPYFPVDSLNLYWNDLLGPKYALYLPNNGHGISDFGRLIPALGALQRSVALGKALPVLQWEYRDAASALQLCVRADIRPRTVRAWTAESEDLDFRDARWKRHRARSRSGVFSYRLDRPTDGYVAVFGEAVFGHGRSAYPLSTTLRIMAAPGERAPPGPIPTGNAHVCESGL